MMPLLWSRPAGSFVSGGVSGRRHALDEVPASGSTNCSDAFRPESKALMVASIWSEMGKFVPDVFVCGREAGPVWVIAAAEAGR